MNFLLTLFTKAFIFFWYRKDIFFFERSKKYIVKWGVGSYGIPYINSFDKKSMVSVGNYVSIASNVSFLLGANHKLGYITTYPLDRIDKEKNTFDASERGNITIGNDVWIGYGATLIGEITVGNGAIIGAHALVVDDVPPYAVVGGVPARVIKYRFSEDEIRSLEAIKWWDWNKEKILENSADIYSKDIKSFIHKYSKN